MPPSGGGRRAFFSATDRLLARAALRPGVSLRTQGCACGPWDAPCTPFSASVCSGVSPVRSAMPPVRSAMPPVRSAVPLHVLQCLCTPLCCPACLRQPCGASRPAIQSAHLPRPAAALRPYPRRPSAPTRGGPLPRPAARQRKSPAAPKGAAGPCSFRCQAMRLR